MTSKVISFLIHSAVCVAVVSCHSRPEPEYKAELVEMVTDSLAKKHNGLKFKTVFSSFSYKAEETFTGRTVASSIRVRDIIKERDSVYLLVGIKSNAIFKIRLNKTQLKEIEAQEAKPIHEAVIAFNHVRVQRIHKMWIEYDDFDQAQVGFNIEGNRFLVSGDLVEYKANWNE